MSHDYSGSFRNCYCPIWWISTPDLCFLESGFWISGTSTSGIWQHLDPGADLEQFGQIFGSYVRTSRTWHPEAPVHEEEHSCVYGSPMTGSEHLARVILKCTPPLNSGCVRTGCHGKMYPSFKIWAVQKRVGTFRATTYAHRKSTQERSQVL